MYARDYSQETVGVRSRYGRLARVDEDTRYLRQAALRQQQEQRSQARSQRSKQRRQVRQQQRVWGQARDAGIAIGVNVAIAAAVLTGAARLLPMLQMQQENLAGVQSSLETVEGRVSVLRERVELGLDPLQMEAAITEHLNVLPPQRIVVDLQPTANAVLAEEEGIIPESDE